VQGERPWSIWKIALVVIVVLSLGLGAIYLSDPEALNLPQPDWMN
jgi:hypothetical protein